MFAVPSCFLVIITHHSPLLTCPLLPRMRAESEWKGFGAAGLIRSPPLLKGQRWCCTSRCQHKVGESSPLSHHPLIITDHSEFLLQNAVWN